MEFIMLYNNSNSIITHISIYAIEKMFNKQRKCDFINSVLLKI